MHGAYERREVADRDERTRPPDSNVPSVDRLEFGSRRFQEKIAGFLSSQGSNLSASSSKTLARRQNILTAAGSLTSSADFRNCRAQSRYTEAACFSSSLTVSPLDGCGNWPSASRSKLN